MDPVEIKIFGLPGIYFLWILTFISFYLFLSRIIKIINKVLRKSRPENRFDNIPKRIKNFIIYVLGQKKLFSEKSIGLPHFLFFWGFIFYAGSFFWNLLRGLFPFLPVPYADEVFIVSFLLEIFGLLVLVSIIVAVIRRIFFAPPYLQKSIDAVIILSLITILMATLLLGQGFKSINYTEASSWISISIGSMINLSGENAVNLSAAMWWIHIITVLVFLAYIPYSKHIHLLVSPFNVFFSNIHKKGDLNINEEEDISNDTGRWNEFTWKELLNSLSCAECGRCDRACPALNSGYKLSPRIILHQFKEYLYEHPLKNKTNGSLLDSNITEEEIWQCTTCFSCMEKCPVLNEHLNLIARIRRLLINKGYVDPTLQDMLVKMNRYGNSFGQSDRNRAKWAKDLGFNIKDARKEEVDYLWLVGDYASFDPRVQPITQITAKIFNKANLDFGILYDGEKNFGNDIRRIGEEGLFETLRDKNLQTLHKSKFKRIVTTDPHTLNTLKHEYNLDSKIPIRHYSELLYELISEKRLKAKNPGNRAVTYHDPCYLGRYNGIYNPPRQILKELGLALIEMPRNHQNSYCCGAGGGRIWMEDKIKIQERPAESRIKEAIALIKPDTLITACPKDIVMFQDAAKTTGNENKIKIRDIAEVVWESIETNGKEN